MRLGAKVRIKPVEEILSLLSENQRYKNLIRFNYNMMKEYCGKQGKVTSFMINLVTLESDTEPALRHWVWHVDWLTIGEKVLEGDKL